MTQRSESSFKILRKEYNLTIVKMNQFLAFVRKEFYHIFRDKWTTAILLALPIMMLILFGYAISTEVKNIKVAAIDVSKDESTRAIIEKVKSNPYFTYIGEIQDPLEARKMFNSGKVNMALIFSENFHDGLLNGMNASVQIITDGSDPNTAKTMTGYATSIVADYQREFMENYNVPILINPNVRLLYNPTMKGAYNFVPGVMGMILMLICAMMTSISIAREKETGTMEILLVSPLKPFYIIISKTIPYFVISVINLTTILLLSTFMLHVPIAGSLFWLIVISLVYIFVALSLGLLISSIVNTQQTALLISGMMLMLPIIMLSGMMFPIENMPAPLQWLSNIIPAKWFIIAVKKIMIKGLGVSGIYQEMFILLGMGIALTVASLKKFKFRLS